MTYDRKKRRRRKKKKEEEEEDEEEKEEEEAKEERERRRMRSVFDIIVGECDCNFYRITTSIIQSFNNLVSRKN